MQYKYRCKGKDCGRQVDFGTNYCPYCGRKLDWSKEQKPPANYQQQAGFGQYKEPEVKRFKGQSEETFSAEVVTLALLTKTSDVVKTTSQSLRKHIDTQQYSKLPKVEEEIFYFFVFALDYWWATTHTQVEQSIFREAFTVHLKNFVDLEALQERITGYAQILNEKRVDFNTMSFAFGRQLNKYCGMPGLPALLVLPAQLFSTAQDCIHSLKSV